MQNLSSDIQNCAAALARITDSVTECGRLIADCCDRHKGFLTALGSACPGVSRTLLNRLEKVGRGQLDPRIALGIEHGIFAERLPIQDQTKIIDIGVPVAVGPGGADTLNLTLEQMDRSTANRVLRGGTIATLPQQRAEIFAQEDANRRSLAQNENADKEERSRSAKVLDALPLSFAKDRKSVTISRSVKLTLPQLYLIVAELERA
jgi:hypothetical protein